MSRRGALIAASRFVSGSGPSPDDPLKAARLAFWPMNEASGQALDASGNARHLTLAGGTPPTRITDGAAGTVMSFGGNGYLAASVPIIGTRTRYAILVRAAYSALSDDGHLYNESDVNGFDRGGIYAGSDNRMNLTGTGGYTAVSSASYADGAYRTFIGQRRADSEWILYVDGVQVAAHLFGGDSSASAYTATTLGICRIFGSTFWGFVGKMQCAAVFDRALTTSEIAELTSDPRSRLT